jgi:peroxiredoxin Q/BCP
VAYPDFVAAGAEVFGLSPDSSEVLAKYAKAKETPFLFVSDSTRSIANAYGAATGKRQPRVTFVIAKGGRVAKSLHHEFLIPKHVSETVALVKTLG